MKYSAKNKLYTFLIATNRGNNYTTVLPLKNKKFDTLFSAIETLQKNKHFSHIKTILSDKESGFRSKRMQKKILDELNINLLTTSHQPRSEQSLKESCKNK